MYTYTASGQILTALQMLLDLNGIGYEPVMPSEEKVLGFITTRLGPEEILPYLEAARGCEVQIIPLRPEDISQGNVRRKIRRYCADMGYVSDKDRDVIRSATSIKETTIQ